MQGCPLNPINVVLRGMLRADNLLILLILISVCFRLILQRCTPKAALMTQSDSAHIRVKYLTSCTCNPEWTMGENGRVMVLVMVSVMTLSCQD